MKLSMPVFRLKRQARLLAREQGIPLHQALDSVARGEGFQAWSHLAARLSQAPRPAAELLSQLKPGDLVLLGARPGHGKTLLALELAVEAARAGRQGFFFTLEDNEEVVRQRIASFGAGAGKLPGSLFLDTSDEICADTIIDRLKAAPPGAVAVIDYLQLLDQRRSNPSLEEQVQALREFATAAGVVIVVLSQIDRSFDSSSRKLPGLADVRLPNPLDLSVFTKSCFLHEGEVRLETIA